MQIGCMQTAVSQARIESLARTYQIYQWVAQADFGGDRPIPYFHHVPIQLLTISEYFISVIAQYLDQIKEAMEQYFRDVSGVKEPAGISNPADECMLVGGREECFMLLD